MGHVPVPWFIGGQAYHSDRIARLLAYNAVGGRQGVIAPLDCRVLALETPGQAVQVMPGAYSILSQTHPYEAYVGMVDTADIVGTTPTGSSGGRSDLVCIIVENSNDVEENWDTPADPQNGPYIFTEIITGVPATTTNWSQLGLMGSAIAIARIDFPPNTATVTQSMIKDLRGNVGSDTSTSGSGSGGTGTSSGGATSGGVTAGDPVGGGPVAAAPTPVVATFTDAINCTSNSKLNPPALGAGTRTTPWTNWPSEANWTVPIPAWATDAALYYTINPTIGANVYGGMRFNFNNGALVSQTVIFDKNVPLETAGGNPCHWTNGGGDRPFYQAGGRVAIPAALRGTNVSLKIEAFAQDDTTYVSRGVSNANPGTLVYLNIVFKQGAVIS